MLETQIQHISSTIPCTSNGIPSKDPVQESVKSIAVLFERQAPESSEQSLGTDERGSKVDGQEIILSMSEVSSDAILNRLQNQLGGLEIPTIQCIIGLLKVRYALCDWEASANNIPKMVYDCLNEDSLVPVSWCLHLVDYRKVGPYGLVNDLFIEIRVSSTLVDFLVVDMDPHQQTTIIFGAPFVKSVKAAINRKKGIINMKVKGKYEKFTFPQKP
jgi:hypothetical protein